MREREREYTSFPSVIRLCDVIRAFMTTTQLEFVSLSPNISTSVGMETCGLLVNVIKTKQRINNTRKRKREKNTVKWQTLITVRATPTITIHNVYMYI